MNKQNLKFKGELYKRIITAIVLIIAVIAGMFYLPQAGFNFFALVIGGAAVWEFAGFFARENIVKRASFLLIFCVLATFSQFFQTKILLCAAVFWWIVAPYFLWRYSLARNNYFKNIIWQWLLGSIIFVPFFASLILVHEEFGPEILLYLLAIIWVADIGAYFAGRFFGKRLLAPSISPKKTVEGMVGGVFSSLIVALIGMGIFAWQKSMVLDFSGVRIFSFLLLVMIVSLWSVIGDLFESMLKREAGVKDSGILLPGHGGVYDRIDSLTAAFPIFVLGLLLIGF